MEITRDADGRVVRSPDDVAVGDVLITQLAAGSLRSRAEPDDRGGPGGVTRPTPRRPPDQPGYAQALDELDGILRELEGTDVDVDRLADRVARATS